MLLDGAVGALADTGRHACGADTHVGLVHHGLVGGCVAGDGDGALGFRVVAVVAHVGRGLADRAVVADIAGRGHRGRLLNG